MHYQKLFDLFDSDNDDAHTGNVPVWIWAAGHRLLTPWKEDRVKFAFNTPTSFGDTPVDQQVFGALLHNITDPDGISESGLIKLVERFSASCMKQEWIDLYQPILQRKTDHGLVLGDFNHYVYDTEWQVSLLSRPKPVLKHIEGTGFFYAFNNDWMDIYIVIFEDHVEIVDHNFATVPYDDVAEACMVLCGDSNINYPLIIETMCDGYELHLTDIVELDKVDIWPSSFRRDILEQVFMKIMETYEGYMITLGDGFVGGEDNISDIIKEFTNIGFDNLPILLFKSDNKPFTHPDTLVPIYPFNTEITIDKD
jgi:hypothetical protein